jgi:hypothetical protein
MNVECYAAGATGAMQFVESAGLSDSGGIRIDQLRGFTFASKRRACRIGSV